MSLRERVLMKKIRKREVVKKQFMQQKKQELNGFKTKQRVADLEGELNFNI